jgi:hypothetical protein
VEKLRVRILTVLLDSLLIGQAKSLLDEQRTKRQLCWFCRSPSLGAELSGIGCFYLVRWHQRDEKNLAVLPVQCAAKRQMKLLE